MQAPPTGRRHLILPVVAIKVAFVALIVLLPSSLAIGLGVTHGIAALVVLVALSAIVLVRRRSARRSGHRRGVRSASEWDAVYAGTPRWDIDRPQPAFRALADAGRIHGRVLDAGCGTGEHVLMAADLGLDATGIDLSPTALRAAQRKARDRGLTARFLEHDARRLADLGERFDTILDCGLFQIFDDGDRATFVAGVRSALLPGGRYFVLCFSDQTGDALGSSRQEITTTFADGWRIDGIEPSTLDSRTDPDGIPAWLVALTRT